MKKYIIKISLSPSDTDAKSFCWYLTETNGFKQSKELSEALLFDEHKEAEKAAYAIYDFGYRAMIEEVAQ